jgi:hypothetical protein
VISPVVRGPHGCPRQSVAGIPPWTRPTSSPSIARKSTSSGAATKVLNTGGNRLVNRDNR